MSQAPAGNPLYQTKPSAWMATPNHQRPASQSTYFTTSERMALQWDYQGVEGFGCTVQPLYPFPPAELLRQLHEALSQANSFIRNGVALGYIRMPEPEIPDPAHRVPGAVEQALKDLDAYLRAQVKP